jgi:hypothetical protein
MKLKIFVSSTCYDLSIIRSQLKSFIENMGYDAVLSEYNDIFYDPKDHTHESCVKEVTNADVVILIIGSRFGGKGIPNLKSLVDFKTLSTSSLKTKILENKEQLSVTQYEIFKAIESNIPVYCFVEESVWHDHRVYEENKENEEVIKSMRFPSIEKNDSAPFIFEFINFMRARTHNNAMYPFGKLEDIEGCLLKQWSNLFQDLLSENKNKRETSKQIDQIVEQLNEMKALIMSSVDTNETKDIARGVIKFRLMITYIDEFMPYPDIIYKEETWEELLRDCGIVAVKEFDSEKMQRRIAIIKEDKTFFLHHYSFSEYKYEEYKKLWPEFSIIKKETKRIIVEAVRDSANVYSKDLKYYDMDFDSYLHEIKSEGFQEGIPVG